MSLDLSKAFDGTHYGKAFLRHGVSQHLVWALRLVYWEQRGQIINKRGTSREFDIKAGVRQGRVLSPTQCSCVLEVALKKGRKQLQAGCLDFGDGGIPLLDLRFADDILLFATSSDEAARIVDALVTCLKEVGLAPSVSKTKILTTQALPGKSVPTQNGLEMEILDATKAHKWLGCLLSTLNAGDKEAGLDFRLQATLRAFYANQLILCDKNFALVPGWNIPNRPPTFPLGVETSIVLQIQRLGAMDGCCHESEPLGSTLRILHSILQYIE